MRKPHPGYGMRIGASLSVVNEAIWILKRAGVVSRGSGYVIIDALVQAHLSLKLSRIAIMAILYYLIHKLNRLFQVCISVVCAKTGQIGFADDRKNNTNTDEEECGCHKTGGNGVILAYALNPKIEQYRRNDG
ncbi:MAG: hypothetical protein AB2727_17515 [Candidatus Thiodiazotropha taylori]